ncbi:unnamed protein product, partial [Lymnaea stagnalis]
GVYGETRGKCWTTNAETLTPDGLRGRKTRSPPDMRHQKSRKPPDIRLQKLRKPPDIRNQKLRKPPDRRNQKSREPPDIRHQKLRKPPDIRNQTSREPPDTRHRKARKPPDTRHQKSRKPPDTRQQKSRKPPDRGRTKLCLVLERAVKLWDCRRTIGLLGKQAHYCKEADKMSEWSLDDKSFNDDDADVQPHRYRLPALYDLFRAITQNSLETGGMQPTSNVLLTQKAVYL